MGVELPPLPDPGGYRDVDGDWVRHGYTDEAVRAYATLHASNLQGEVERLRDVARMYLQWVNDGLIKDPSMVAIEEAARAALSTR